MGGGETEKKEKLMFIAYSTAAAISVTRYLHIYNIHVYVYKVE